MLKVYLHTGVPLAEELKKVSGNVLMQCTAQVHDEQFLSNKITALVIS
jgi:hypothetical protein